jgi:molybdopterin synthase catalytic subunit
MRFTAVIDQPIDRGVVARAVAHPSHGGECFFFGAVRDLNVGRRVVAVSYEAHEPLCRKVFAHVLDTVAARYDEALRLYLVHRVGRLVVGEVSVAIGASSVHRDEAFRAARDVIEAVKHEAPIWKQEHFEDGDSAWVQGHSLCK